MADNRSDLLATFGSLAEVMGAEDPAADNRLPADLATAIVNLAPALAPWASWASLANRSSSARVPVTAASTGPEAEGADALQYGTRQGPCLQALSDPDPHAMVVCSDLAADTRWPALAAGLLDVSLPVRSAVSCALVLPYGQHTVLNLYGDQVLDRAHPPRSAGAAARLAAAAVSVSLAAWLHRRKADNMAEALESNRQIGAAAGILMLRKQTTYEQALDLMRVTSQNGHLKLRAVAEAVLLTGTLPTVIEEHVSAPAVDLPRQRTAPDGPVGPRPR